MKRISIITIFALLIIAPKANSQADKLPEQNSKYLSVVIDHRKKAVQRQLVKPVDTIYYNRERYMPAIMERAQIEAIKESIKTQTIIELNKDFLTISINVTEQIKSEFIKGYGVIHISSIKLKDNPIKFNLQKWNYDQSGKIEITTKLKTELKSIDSSMLNVNLIVKYATSLNEVTVNKNNLKNKIQLDSHNIEILGINNNIIGLAIDTIDIDKTVINLINLHTIDSSYKSPVAISEADKLGYQTNYSNDKNREPRYLYELIVIEEKMDEQEIIQAYKKNLSKVNSMQVYFDQQVELIANLRPIGQKFILYSYDIDSEIIQIK